MSKSPKAYIHLTLLFISFLCLAPTDVLAQQLKAYKGHVKNAYNYWFYTPGKTAAPGSISITQEMSNGKKPLVIFLHGASLCGRNLEKVRRYGTLDAIRRGLKLDAYVLAPQNPGGSWEPGRVNRLVDWAISKYDIDTTRIYVLGMSLGGFGTLDYTAASSSRVAAAMALCGGATTNNLRGLCNVPLCIMHGTGDRDVSWKQSQEVVNAMKASGDTSRLIYKLIPKASHGALARYLYSPDVYSWLFQHSLSDENRRVNRQYRFNFANLHNVYKLLGEPNQNLVIEYGEPEEDLSTTAALAETLEEESNSNPESSNSTEKASRSKGNGIHKVRSGETLTHIATKHHVSVAHLCKLNHLKRTSVLQIGQKIKY